MSFACGGATFTTEGDAGSSSGGASSGAGSSGASSGSGSSGASSGSGSSGASSGSGSSSGGTSSSSSSSSGGTSGSSSGGTSSSSGGCGPDCVDAGPASPCPAELPPKSACSPEGLECEYGSNPVLGCDPVSTCEQTWSEQAASDPNCTTTLGPACPLTFDIALQGAACSSEGLVCNYPRGRCACVSSSFGGPVMLVDAAVKGHWACQDPGTADCPEPRAPLGSACKEAGLLCNYGACTVPGGSAEQCEDGIWKPAPFACPVIAAGQ